MEGTALRHWMETATHYQKQFAEQGQKICKLVHTLYALLGPSQAKQERHAAQRGLEVLHSLTEEDNRLNFQILLDIVQFHPEDTIIQILKGWLLIKPQHGCRMDEHGFVSRGFTRTYKLPAGTHAPDLSAVYLYDGSLTVGLKDVIRTK
ncbi:heat shock protein beta-3 [Microcaecilia unicolor]|uniref:Heat shock protein beta-3 n=1 Tax=Microcaecilia unicolor TaxID=1415580 RepID=A0A6P7X6P4_9AMPH|nr:heat shock protein beta-3 [Microcaecilia unicolor]